MKESQKRMLDKIGTAKGREGEYLLREVRLDLPMTNFMRDYSLLDVSDPDYLWLIALCGVEARGERREGIQAVAEVAMNRLYQRKTYFGMSLPNVVNKHQGDIYQFEGMNPANPSHNWLAKPKASELARIVLPCLQAYFEINSVIGLRNVCYFHKVGHPFGEWASRLVKHSTIGNHVFYYDPALSL